MADPFAPVAAGIIPPDPNQGMRSLSAILGIRQQRQNLETGQATQQSAQAKATIDTQGANENQSLAKLLADPVGNGLIDGEGNPTKNAQSIVMRAAPTTGSEAYDKVVNAARSKIEFNGAINGLKGNERKELVDNITGSAASPDSTYEDMKDNLTGLVESKKGTPEYDSYRKIADISTQSIDHLNKKEKDRGLVIPTGKEAWRGGAANLGRTILGASGVVGAGGIAAPQTGTMSSGASQQPGTFAPALQGGAFAPSGPATQNQIPPGYTMVNGQLVRADNSGLSLPPVRQPGQPGQSGQPGVPTGAGPGAQTGTPQPRLQPLQAPAVNANPGDVARYNATMEESRQHVQGVSAAANDPQNGTQVTRYRNKQIEDLTNVAPTGPGKEIWNHMASFMTGNTAGTPYQTIGHYLAQNTSAIASKMGVPNTNMGAESAAAAAGNVAQNPAAIREITRVNDAINTAFDSYNKGLAKVTNNGSTTDKVPAFRQAFGKSFDMNMFRYEDAVRNNDRKEVDRIESQLGPKGMQQLAQKRKTIQSLANTGDLP